MDDKDLKTEPTEAEEENYLNALSDDSKKSAKVVDPVDQVAKEESDRLLKSEDDALKRQFDPPKGSKSIKDRVKNAAKFWWQHKKLRYGTFVALFLLMSAAVLMPNSRYFILNSAGVRVDSSMNIVDSQTGLPLKNIPVRIQGQEKRSDDDGFVEFTDLKLGSSQLVVEKLGYAVYEKDVTLGLGSNPLGNQPLVATGTQFTFVLSDWLSGQPIMDGEATSGEDIAQANDAGQIVLTVGELDDDTEAVVVADGYREERVRLSEVSGELEIKMAPAKKHVFVSNRTGEYDLYKIDVDGQSEEILVPASGKEREIPFVLPHQSKNIAAYISSRDGEVNSGGFVLDGLYIVNINSGDLHRIARSEQLQIIGWSDKKLIYTAVTEGVSARNPERSRVFSYDVDSGETVQLATSNYFNDVQLVNDTVYYSVSSFAVPVSSAKLFSVLPDGSSSQTVVDQQVWTIVRSDFMTLHFRGVDAAFNTQWYTQSEVGAAVQPVDAPPVSQASRHYTVSEDGEHALWVDERDGKGVLLNYVIASGSEEIIQTAPGLSDPVYWLDDRTMVYRITTSQETADYVLSLDGGEPQKIADVVGNQSRYLF